MATYSEKGMTTEAVYPQQDAPTLKISFRRTTVFATVLPLTEGPLRQYLYNDFTAAQVAHRTGVTCGAQRT